MIPYQNCEIFASVSFYVLSKIVCAAFDWQKSSMYNKKLTPLTSIPENIEEDEDVTKKWVPKKKHEVLKAKYKCLKKLFQLYDASVIGMLPDTQNNTQELVEYDDENSQKTRRRKRSHRTKSDACAGTTEPYNGDIEENEKCPTVVCSVIKDLNINSTSRSTLPVDVASGSDCEKYSVKESKTNVSTNRSVASVKECEYTQTVEIPQNNVQHMILNRQPSLTHLTLKRQPKITRFQLFMQRLFGIRQEQCGYNFPKEHVYAASDNNILQHSARRRRRSLRFRRLKKPKKIHSEIDLRDVRSPVILSYVQSVQKNCLSDTTPRQCPMNGCRMTLCGIINYNDHLNLCHFPDRKYICHYCHEGFDNEHDKNVHENEHIGISKMNPNVQTKPVPEKATKVASDTQTDPYVSKSEIPEDKLKKIVSFFDKIADSEQMISEIKKVRNSEASIKPAIPASTVSDRSGNSTDSEKGTVSCMNLPKRRYCSLESEFAQNQYDMPIKCQFCGETFDYRRQLSLHVDLEHRVHDKFSKFHSCQGIVSHQKRPSFVSEDGKIKVQLDDNYSNLRVDDSSTMTHSVARRKSNETLSVDGSTNIVYYSSSESLSKKPSVLSNIIQKVRSYKWEPGTKIIRV